ncbi:MAG: epoxyqueuosine reductase [Clostridia bacterium]|nr:epoxyqueuosine reductase [Clostridia bacterium]
MTIQKELKEYLLNEGACDVGFCKIPDSDVEGCDFAVSIVVRLSNTIIDEINGEPTHTYFNHYRTVNSFIDSLLLKCGMFLQKKGYKYLTVAASQSINKDGWNYKGRYSHKKTATLSGLGTIGKSSMFLHKDYGAAVRLGTVFTNCEFKVDEVKPVSICGSCRKCVDACPSGAIKGTEWTINSQREDMFDAEKCSEYMKKNFKHIGRGAVCGVCMSVCPYTSKGED